MVRYWHEIWFCAISYDLLLVIRVLLARSIYFLFFCLRNFISHLYYICDIWCIYMHVWYIYDMYIVCIYDIHIICVKQKTGRRKLYSSRYYFTYTKYMIFSMSIMLYMLLCNVIVTCLMLFLFLLRK